MCGVASWHAPFVGSPQDLRQRQLTYRGIAKGERCRTHDQYRLLLHLAETLSFTRTAADCHVSPATLSRTVQRLEAATGHRLLDRGPHGVCLTTHGRAFRQYAAEAWTQHHVGATRSDRRRRRRSGRAGWLPRWWCRGAGRWGRRCGCACRCRRRGRGRCRWRG
ncbi:LysR family transcriptional regulator [Streptomyces sp. LARHCF252]